MGLRLPSGPLILGRFGGLQIKTGGAPVFTPGSLTSLLAWLEADVGTSTTTDNTALSQWNDQSANAKHFTQATGSMQPLFRTGIQNSKPGISFDGSNDFLSSTTQTGSKPFSMGFVANLTNVSAGRTLADAVNPSGIAVDFNSTVNARLLKSQSAAIGTATSGITAGTAFTLFVTYDGSGNYAFYLNGSAAGSGTNNQTFTASNIKLGISNPNTNPLLGFMHAFVYTSAVFTSGERTSLQTYWHNKWGTP